MAAKYQTDIETVRRIGPRDLAKREAELVANVELWRKRCNDMPCECGECTREPIGSESTFLNSEKHEND